MEHLTGHILLNERIRKQLCEELREPMANFTRKMPGYKVLEQLPYLQACIKQGLRYVQHTVSYGCQQ
jgi:hypothetical protein